MLVVIDNLEEVIGCSGLENYFFDYFIFRGFSGGVHGVFKGFSGVSRKIHTFFNENP